MTAELSMASTYTDFQGLATLRTAARERDPTAAKAVAREFEALFIQMMLKSMREASMGDTLFDSDGTRIYRELFDKQVAIDLAAKGDLRFADLMMKQLGVQEPEPDLLPADAPYAGETAGSGRSLRMPPVPTEAQRAFTAALMQRAMTSPVEDPYNQRSGDATGIDPYNGVSAAAAGTPAAAHATIESPEDFVRALKPHAEAAARAIGVQPEVLLAQAALETGWGARMIRRADGSNSHNLFGIKAGSDWTGARARVSTLEYDGGVPRREMASFRAYDSYAESFADYVAFLKSHPRYAQALEQSGDARAFMRSLQQAGYATDPDYARKVVDVMQRSAIAGASADL